MDEFAEIEGEVRASRQGEPTLLIGGKAVHSLYHPLRHAQQAAGTIVEEMRAQGCDHLALVGMGLGYLQEALRQQGCRHCVVWDPFPHIRRGLPVPVKALDDMVVADDFETFQEQMCLLAKPQAKPLFKVHPGYDMLCLFEKNQGIECLHRIYGSTHRTTRDNAIISPRTLESTCSIPFYKSVHDLDGRYRGQQGIIIAPGPSLKAAIPYLKQRRGGVIIAALQAVPLLQKEGIDVDFVVLADPNDHSKILGECHKGFGSLLLEAAVDPSALQWAPEKTFLFNLYSDQLHQVMWDAAGWPSIEERVATVSEIMLLLSQAMGFDKLLLLGMDFCWKDERYSYRTQDTDVSTPSKGFTVKTIHGEPAWTMYDYFQAYRFVKYTCQHLAASGVSITQYTEGLPVPSATAIAAKDIPNILTDKPPAPQPPHTTHTGSPHLVDTAKQLLRYAENTTDLRARQKPAHASIPAYDAMRYLEEIPPSQRHDACSAQRQRLEQQQKS